MKHLLRDDGSATVTSAGLITAVTALAFAVIAVCGRVADSHRAAVVADLSAVAAATAHYLGFDACAVAEQTAALNAATISACAIADGDVVVTAVKGRAHASARAGPA